MRRVLSFVAEASCYILLIALLLPLGAILWGRRGVREMCGKCRDAVVGAYRDRWPPRP